MTKIIILLRKLWSNQTVAVGNDWNEINAYDENVPLKFIIALAPRVNWFTPTVKIFLSQSDLFLPSSVNVCFNRY